MRIGFFDSGIGGLTVLREALEVLSGADYIYYADTMHVPYGTKTKEEVRRYIFEAADFIASHRVDALVVACNTATSLTINDLRSKYAFPIIGMEPAVKPAVEKSSSKRVLVTATPLTLKEERFHNLVSRVDSEHKVDLLPLPGLVEFAEDFVFERCRVVPYLREQLAQYDISRYGTVVLGCTHFTYFKRFFRDLFPPDVDIIDGNCGTVKHIKAVLEEHAGESLESGTGTISFYSSGVLEKDSSRFERYLKLPD